MKNVIWLIIKFKSNTSYTGWTGEKIVFAGDSAGANIILSMSLRAIEAGIRLPVGVLSVYGTLLCKFLPSPSRIISLMDTILPMGFLAQCLAGIKIFLLPSFLSI